MSDATAASSPEIGQRCATGAFHTNYHDVGAGAPMVLVHGSGPGVSAWANWRGVIGAFSARYRVIAPDMVGFGYTEVVAGQDFSVAGWIAQLLALADALGLARFHLVGNSFGGALALHFARRYPERVDRLVLMGAVSVNFPITDGLEKVWAYTPSHQAMRALMGVFAYNQALITEDLITLRYQASMQRGMDRVYEGLFPAPRQRWVEALAQSEHDLVDLRVPTLLVHGRDDQVIPLAASIRALRLIPRADLVVFGECGHWVQIEKGAEFVAAVLNFLAAGDGGST